MAKASAETTQRAPRVPRAGSVLRAGTWAGTPKDRVVLDYEGRFLRRKRLQTEAGAAVMVDLPQTVSLEPGDALHTAEGDLIEVAAAAEPLLRIEGDLVRLAWHIGNRHTPCEVAADHLLIRDDHVLAGMLAQLGAVVVRVDAPFHPEGGAYGFGRTHGHSHGPDDGAGHDHDHDHVHEPGHDHVHDHVHEHVHAPGHGDDPGHDRGPGR